MTDPTNRSANAFKFGLRAGSSRGYTTVPQSVLEGAGIERVSVQNHIVHPAEEAVFGVGQIPGDLRHPVPVRLTGDPRDLYGAGLKLDDEQDDVPDQAGPWLALRR